MANWQYENNHGRITRIYPHTDKLFFRFGGKTSEVKTDMNPKDGYYFIPVTHPNYKALADLLYLAAEHDWNIFARPKEALTADGYAEVTYLVQDFVRP
ncbi:MAG TPA: hypothetical protein PLK30_02200 [Blastocatellia bacterium]|nr:hypothetical protein [Blastocatellia bacterium]